MMNILLGLFITCLIGIIAVLVMMLHYPLLRPATGAVKCQQVKVRVNLQHKLTVSRLAAALSAAGITGDEASILITRTDKGSAVHVEAHPHIRDATFVDVTSEEVVYGN